MLVAIYPCVEISRVNDSFILMYNFVKRTCLFALLSFLRFVKYPTLFYFLAESEKKTALKRKLVIQQELVNAMSFKSLNYRTILFESIFKQNGFKLDLGFISNIVFPVI